MADIQHSVQITVKPEAVFPLVASGQGFSQWWAADMREDGGAVELGFFNRATLFHLRPKAMTRPVRAEWACDSGGEWENTLIDFRLEENASGTLLRFTHGDWRAASDYFMSCNTTWGELLYRLKATLAGRCSWWEAWRPEEPED